MFERDEREKGAALVEFTLVLSLLAMLAFGIVEFGMAFQDRLTVSSATQSAARIGSVIGSEDDSDYQMLLTLEQGLQSMPHQGMEVVQHVDVYLAGSEGTPIGNCVTGDRCNRYYYKPGAGCSWSPCPDPDAGYSGWDWVPSGRDVELPGLDILGVEVAFTHEWLTGGIVPLPKVTCDSTPGSVCWADSAVMRLEPKNYQQVDPGGPGPGDDDD